MTNEQITQALQYLVGTRYVPTVKAYISELTGRARVVGPNEVLTKDFRLDRVNVSIEAGLISGYTFG